MANVTKQSVIIEFDAETGNITKVSSQLKDDMQDVAKSAEKAGDAIADIEKDGKKAGTGLGKMGKTGSLAFKSLGTAIKATGIGLIVALVAQLIMKFTENKKVADMLSIAMAGLGAVFNTIIDAGTWIIDNLVGAFQNPQAAVEGFKDKLFALGDYLKTLLEVYFTPMRLVLLKLKEGFLQAAIGAKEFFGGDATELRKSLKETKEDVDTLVKDFKDNVDTLKEPFVKAAEAVADYVVETAKAVKESVNLERQMVKLRDAQRDVDVAFAEGLAQLEALKKTRDDERLSIEDRIAAAQKAAAMEKEFTDERVRIAQETVALLEQEISLQGATEERLQAVADARIAAADAQAASAAVQTELMTSTFALEQEIIAQEAEVAALRREFTAENLQGIEAEKQAVKDQLQDRLTAIDLFKISEDEKAKLREEARASHNQQLLDIDKAYAEEAAAQQDELDAIKDEKDKARREKELQDRADQQRAILDTAKATLGSLSALNDAFGGLSEKQEQDRANRELAIQNETDAQKRYQMELQNYEINKEQEKQQKAQFDRGKALSIAEATIATGEAAISAYKSMVGIPVVGPGLAVAAAAAATAAGIANINSIKKQTFQGVGEPPQPPSAPNLSAEAGSSATTTGAPSLDLSFLGEGAVTNEPIQAYVLADNVTNAQQANQLIQEQASL